MSRPAGSTFTGLGKSDGYKSTVKMNFRGQDKTMQPSLGQNPNDPEDNDEYIVNLQQQIHFMELEMRILKEKVMEDEKKSGIGSLYDDDKTSHQHINLLKTKYAQMRREHDKKEEGLSKNKLTVVGDGYILKAQIDILRETNSKLDQTYKVYEAEQKKRHFDLDKEVKGMEKARAELEREIMFATDQRNKQQDEHFDHWRQLTLTENDDNELKRRHATETRLNTDLKDKKAQEIEELKAEKKAQEDKFDQWKEMQDLLEEARDLRAKIEQAFVDIQHKEIEVKMIQESVNFLNDRKNYLIEEKNEAERRNEELKHQVKGQQELAAKRLQQRLNRDKNAETKELLANEEMLIQHNEDLTIKLADERKKYDGLLHDRLILDEKLRLLKESMADDTEKVEEQNEFLKQLKGDNDDQSKTLDDQTASMNAEKKTQLREEARNRDLNLKFAALTQKLAFIEQNYDYKDNVKGMNLEMLKQLMKSNDQVNTTVQDFVGRMDNVKTEIENIEIAKGRYQDF